MSFSNTFSSTYGQQPSRQQQQPRPQRPARDPKPIIYSLCIPRVFKNISEKRIRAVFYSLKLGFVERVDMVAKTSEKGEEFWRVFVHFSDWNEKNTTAVQMRQKLDAGEKIKIVYDSPWFWLISKSNSAPRQPGRKSGRPAPFIDFNHNPPQRGSSPEPTSPPYTPSLAAGPRTPSPEPRSPHPDRSRPPRSDSMMAGCVEDAPMSPPTHVAEVLAADAEGEEEFRRKKELNALGI